MELLVSVLLFTAPALGAPVKLESTTVSPATTSAPAYQASLGMMNSFESTEDLIEDISSIISPVDLDQVSSTSEDSSANSAPSPVALPPRFKYMEEHLAHTKEDLEEEEHSGASSGVTSTIAPTTELHFTVEETSISPDSTTFPIPPRFKYMEEQVAIKKQDLGKEVDSETSSSAQSTIVHVTEQPYAEAVTEEISTSSEGSNTYSLPPRFKYMEEQLAHKKQDMQEDENYEANIPLTSTTAHTTWGLSTEVTPQETSTSLDSTTFPIPPRFKYMEARISESQELVEEEKFEATTSYPVTPLSTTLPSTTIYTESSTTPSPTTFDSQTTPKKPYPEQKDPSTDFVDLSNPIPTSFYGGFLPGPAGFVRKTKKISEEVKQQMMKEMEVKYGPVIDDIQEFGFILNRENDKLSAEVRSLREKLIATESELVDTRLEKKMSWMPFWN